MRSGLGRVAVGLGIVGVLVVGASAAGASAPPASSTTTAATTTTTTTVAPAEATIDGPPLVAELSTDSSRVILDRGAQLQVTPTDPPPPSTTTLPPYLQLPADSGEGRRVVYHKSRQRVWTVEADETVSKTHPISGNLTWSKPKAGTYSVFSRSSYTCNIKNPNICWRYMVRFAKGPSGDNIGFHEIPTNKATGGKVQTVSQLGTPLSGGCVRQSTPDAQYMWAWAPIGTKVVVIQ